MIDLEKIKEDDNWQKKVFEEQKAKHNVELKFLILHSQTLTKNLKNTRIG